MTGLSSLARTRATAGPAIDVDAFWRDGYAIVRHVYTPEQVEALRADVRASTGPKTDLLGNPRLRRVLTDGNFVAIARRILGSSDLVYAGDSSFTVGNVQCGWHKDNADRLDQQGPDWSGRYTVLRFGVYLQDHRWHTGGLNLRARSHTRVGHDHGATRYLRTGVGDVAVWSLRLTHSGNGTLLRFPWWVRPQPGRADKFRSWQVAPEDGERMALFAAIGLDDHHMARYVDYLKTRQYIVTFWRQTDYSAEAIAEAERAGLKVRDVPSEVRDDPDAGANVTWQPIPY